MRDAGSDADWAGQHSPVLPELHLDRDGLAEELDEPTSGYGVDEEPVAPDDAEVMHSTDDIWEADPADVVEQRRIVPIWEEDEDF